MTRRISSLLFGELFHQKCYHGGKANEPTARIGTQNGENRRQHCTQKTKSDELILGMNPQIIHQRKRNDHRQREIVVILDGRLRRTDQFMRTARDNAQDATPGAEKADTNHDNPNQ